MAALVRPAKEGRASEKQVQALRDMAEFIRTTVMEHIIESAFCYGESLGVCRTI